MTAVIEINWRALIGADNNVKRQTEEQKLKDFFLNNKKGVITFVGNSVAQIHYDSNKANSLILVNKTQNSFIKEIGSLPDGAFDHIANLMQATHHNKKIKTA